MLKPGSKAFFRLTKPVVFGLCLLPAFHLLGQAFDWLSPGLGANPIEAILHSLGLWGLRFLLLGLAITPLRRWTGWYWLTRYRRMIGLFAFFYVLLHFLVYAVLDQGLLPAAIIEDIIKRPYITLGVITLLMLTPLAITSTRGMMRRLGKNWQRLHRLVYPAAILAVWHFYWQVKLDTAEATIYALILTLLLLTRLVFHLKKVARQKHTRTRVDSPGS